MTADFAFDRLSFQHIFSTTLLLGAASDIKDILLKGQVHCFSIQVVMNKCFLQFLKKIWRRSVLLLL